MINSFIKFQLVEINKVKALIFSSIPKPNTVKFTLYKEGTIPVVLKVLKHTSMTYVSIYELELPSNYEFGKEHYICVTDFPAQVIDVSNAVYFKEFDGLFNYEGNDLGCHYYKEHSVFALWAPLATRVDLKIEENGYYKTYPMARTAKGVYRLDIPGDYLNKKYSYLVTNNGATAESTDPYGYGTSENSHYSGVVDIEAIKKMGTVTPKNEIKNYVDAVIYEVGIRDFTEQNHEATDIINKGKYLGFVEEGRKTKGDHPAGLDYLSFLNVTHVQLNPVIDFGTVDDLNVNKKYNWGYDPISMFALEGSYSLHPEIPQERLVEFKTMVNKLHERNIRVIIDVVYNHIYEHVSSCFEKVVPNYFFRRNSQGGTANASGCGDDVASERYMVSKMIQDSMKYFIEVFDVDGYRFDLMGLLDIKTVKHGYQNCKDIKKDIMVYGEGWNMGMELPFEAKACSENASKLPMYGFFNDACRDIIKGPTFRDQIINKGYINGDINYSFGLKHILFGSCLNVSYNPRFEDANQSINYIECHDNNTLYDKLSYSNSDEDEETLLKRVKLGNGVIATLFGVPFYHMGQEIGLSKKGNDNTYNVLDINKMDWNLIDKRWDMVKYFSDLVGLRREVPLYRLHTREDLKKAITYFDFNGLFVYSCKDYQYINGYDEYVVIYNPTNKPVTFPLDDEFKVVFADAGWDAKNGVYTRGAMISPISFTILVKGTKYAKHN